ncbi:carbohydrate ABC transporter permease [Rhizobium pusense]|uniref:carbohydrate ABC transporter permease n=1 Tax=Agrobacterium pusense TaxID=648995 RepID=UPI000D1A3114|nr:carbohydrate ABC transporter permease [Agrobacterium pusense]MDH0912535.1 carbohydrate ABC transporter permease [Agrobacterium pusense]MDH1098618.1 carbohydrate ABC transporter permease [Agrobacterium pusense]MDH1115223.1 carbohydrate ABC transporter permease [Agrobacterium pusense]MDH2197034.1 carbohydrate ABC transporter permease [Agrobacterium pusense]
MADIGMNSSSALTNMFKVRRGRNRFDITDWLTYGFLLLGLVVMFVPIIWIVLSSFKSQTNLKEFPPTVLPYQIETVTIAGHQDPLPLYDVTMPDGSKSRLAQIRRVGRMAQMVDPNVPSASPVAIQVANAVPVKKVHFAVENYSNLLSGSDNRIGLYVYNSLFITVIATLITVIMNAMAAFALSKYRFTGRNVALFAILSTLMIPATVVLVPVFLIVSELGLVGNLWGVILPTVATPTGVFLLRQYMLTIPDELLEAARMDNASEWRIFWRIMLPLSTPALAVVAIFSILSRWNDFLLPLVILNRREVYTLQLALNSFQTEFEIRYDLLLAMTTMTALPLACVFIFLQRYITTGIASTGIK